MSPTPPPSPINPSQAVERIREIIVGRHLERIEQRVSRLEGIGAGSSVPSVWEDRLCQNEARVEALQESVRKAGDEGQLRSARQQEEIQRLAAQIQQIAATRQSLDTQPAVQQLESRLGAWLTNWQGALQTHLNDREQRLATQLRQEVASLWENTESQLTRLQSRAIDSERLEQRFARIAAAARAFAESIAPLPTGPESPPP
jgi:exonuclease VII large subunit